jgi:PAS domain S-box-containing protein
MLPDYRVRQRDHLLDISRALTEQLDLTEVLRTILEASASMLAGEIGLIALYSDHEELEIRAVFGVGAEDLTAFDDLLDDLQTVGFDMNRMNLRTRQIAKRLDLPLRQVVALPLKMSDELMGLILVFRAFSGAASPNDRQILQSFADQAAIAVHNARLYDAVNSERKRLSAILDHSADGIMILDEERTIIRINHALSQMTGWRTEAAVGHPHSDVIRWERRQPGADLEETMSKGWNPDQTLYVEGDLERLDGLTLSVGITYALLTDEAGDPKSIIANVRDITNFRKAEEMKNTFISVVSHELKTPVALIKGYAETLRRSDADWDPEVVQDALEVIEDEADRLTGLIQNLLDASKLQAEGMRLDLTDVDLHKLVMRSAERFQTQSAIHDITVDFPPEFPIIQGDETRLRQVVENLLSNAIKYSPKGGQISVKGILDKGWARVEVRDEGVGLRVEQLTQVFERFYRADESLSQTIRGTGLGLYLARAVVEAHGGRIWAENNPGKGAAFIFVLPH